MFNRLMRVVVLAILCYSATASAGNIAFTKHNLSLSGASNGNTIYSTAEDRICVFCHAPHNANPATPLWNHELPSANLYNMYSSSSLNYNPADYPVPTGSSKLCLSCHDGTIAVGAVVGNTYNMAGVNVDGSITDSTNLDSFNQTDGVVDLSDDHPISIPAIQTAELWAPEQVDANSTSPVQLENNLVQCSSCHDPHDDTNGQFLVLPADSGSLCQECHHQSGWELSAHGTATEVNWTEPSANVTKSVAQWACLGCHDMHRANEQELLQDDGDPNRTLLEEVCYRCHNGTAAPAIQQEFDQTLNLETHPVQAQSYDGLHYPGEDITTAPTHVECSDCHDPHYGQAGNRQLGYDTAGGMLKGITAPQVGPGSYSATPWTPPSYGALHEIEFEYELCLKCHGTNSTMEMTSDHKEEIDVYFNPSNEATHGCIEPGHNRALNPQIIDGFNEELGWDMTTTIACSDCHGSDELPGDPNRIAGPHGSNYQWLLRLSGNPDPAGNDVVCYLCHDPMVYGKYPQGESASAADQARTNFSSHTKGGHWRIGTELPDGVPNVGCLGCHGDFSGLDTRPVDGYTPGGLHGANSGRADRPATTTGVHFLNGFSISIDEANQTKLFTSGATVTCADYDDGTYGCTQHNTPQTYTRR